MATTTMRTTAQKQQQQQRQSLSSLPCTCGRSLRTTDGSDDDGLVDTILMDASFIQLYNNNNNTTSTSSLRHNNVSSWTQAYKNEDLLRTVDYSDTQLLLDAFEAVANNDDGLQEACLCQTCVERVKRSLDLDADRIEKEIQLYRATIAEAQDRNDSTLRAIRNTVSSNHYSSSSSTTKNTDFSNNNTDNNNNNNNNRMDLVSVETLVQHYHDEIDAVRENCRAQLDEIANLVSLKQEQWKARRELDQCEWEWEEHRNALELEALGFDYAETQLRRNLGNAQTELDQLSSVASIRLPRLLWEVQVDHQRGLRYPLINELRLAYRPKGDLQWTEIRAAWALAAQLLLACGTVLRYQSPTWKIVPLSTGAKLIYGTTPEQPQSEWKVYTMGHPQTNGSHALRAWNALLCGIVQHTQNVVARHHNYYNYLDDDDAQARRLVQEKLPYPMDTDRIGDVILTQLDNKNDDAAWSRAIHAMIANLQWVSDQTSLMMGAEALVQSQL